MRLFHQRSALLIFLQLQQLFAPLSLFHPFIVKLLSLTIEDVLTTLTTSDFLIASEHQLHFFHVQDQPKLSLSQLLFLQVQQQGEPLLQQVYVFFLPLQQRVSKLLKLRTLCELYH